MSLEETLHVDLSVLFRLLVSGALTALLGWEREARGRPAGLRTHVLVGLSATLFVALGDVIVFRYADVENVRPDPIRVIEAIVAGVSFIGAGTIFFARGEQRVAGLTTAASLLATAGVGATVGLHLYALAVFTTLALLFVLSALRLLEKRLHTDDDKGHRPERG